MALTAPVHPRRTTAVVKIRSNVSLLTQVELERFRHAIREVLSRRDDRGFQFFAGWHGVPFDLCIHHEPLFLPWHRGYLYHFELALQNVDRDVTLPWWDWLNEAGIPSAYGDEQVNGEPNVLFSTPIEPYGAPRQDDWPSRTTRNPGGTGPGQPQPIPPPLNNFQPEPGMEVEGWVMAAPSYTEMSRRLEALHDNIHGWTGGEMMDVNWAAYDLLFWAHHAMVDRLWRIWQHHHPAAGPPEALLDAAMTFAKPPALTPRDVRDVRQLGYEYAGLVSRTEGTN